ncbi:MAG: hypothetical protein V8R80_00685 [Eubacterium sp.]
MDIFSLLTMIGGLALFLYGMNVMGDGLKKVSGGKLEKILEKLTSNPLKAVLLGAGVTADHSVIFCDNGYGCRFCKLRDYEAFPGSGHYHGCQCGYHDHILDSQSVRY